MDKFYYHLNIYRKKYGLAPLARDTRLEKIAEEYSKILARKGFIDHYALSDSEFERLCFKYDIENIFMKEILMSYQRDGRTALKVLSGFQASPPHNAALLEKKGEGKKRRTAPLVKKYNTPSGLKNCFEFVFRILIICLQICQCHF